MMSTNIVCIKPLPPSLPACCHLALLSSCIHPQIFAVEWSARAYIWLPLFCYGLPDQCTNWYLYECYMGLLWEWGPVCHMDSRVHGGRVYTMGLTKYGSHIELNVCSARYELFINPTWLMWI